MNNPFLGIKVVSHPFLLDMFGERSVVVLIKGSLCTKPENVAVIKHAAQESRDE